MSASPLQVAHCWLAAFNARDLEGLLALYREDAVHLSPKLRARRPETGGRVCGKAALREWWHDAFQRLPSLRYEPVGITADTERVWIEYRRIVPGEPELIVAEVLEIAGGLIAASRVYHG